MIYEPYSVVVVPFPFVDSAKTKPRPALVLSSRQHQKDTSHATLMMITSAENTAWDNDCMLGEPKDCGLKAASVVRQKLFTLDRRMIKKSIGKLAEKDKKQVIALLKKHLLL